MAFAVWAGFKKKKKKKKKERRDSGIVGSGLCASTGRIWLALSAIPTIILRAGFYHQNRTSLSKDEADSEFFSRQGYISYQPRFGVWDWLEKLCIYILQR